jgi:hypothetical protein
VKPGYDNKVNPYAEPWRSLYRATSSRFNIWNFGVSNVGRIEAGPWKDWSCIGSSLAFAPGGREVLQAPFGATADTIIYVDIALKDRPARGTGWQKYWELQAHDNLKKRNRLKKQRNISGWQGYSWSRLCRKTFEELNQKQISLVLQKIKHLQDIFLCILLPQNLLSS